jgi:hypothetical protein
MYVVIKTVESRPVHVTIWSRQKEAVDMAVWLFKEKNPNIDVEKIRKELDGYSDSYVVSVEENATYSIHYTSTDGALC